MTNFFSSKQIVILLIIENVLCVKYQMSRGYTLTIYNLSHNRIYFNLTQEPKTNEASFPNLIWGAKRRRSQQLQEAAELLGLRQFSTEIIYIGPESEL